MRKRGRDTKERVLRLSIFIDRQPAVVVRIRRREKGGEKASFKIKLKEASTILIIQILILHHFKHVK